MLNDHVCRFFLLEFTSSAMAESGLSSIARAQTIWIAPGYALVKSGDTSLGPDSVDLCRAHVDKDSYFTYENHVGVDEILEKDLFEVLVLDGKLLFRRAGHTSYFRLDLGKFDALPVEMTYDEFIRFYIKHRPVFVSFERLYFWKSTSQKYCMGWCWQPCYL